MLWDVSTLSRLSHVQDFVACAGWGPSSGNVIWPGYLPGDSVVGRCWVGRSPAGTLLGESQVSWIHFFAGWFLINPCFLLVETPYPLVNVYITMERSTIFIGKIHELNGGSFHSYVTNYQRVSLWLDNPPWRKDDSDKVNFSSWYNHEE